MASIMKGKKASEGSSDEEISEIKKGKWQIVWFMGMLM